MAHHKPLNIEREAANKAPTIVLTGGGSGGHITPLLAVADELKKLRPGCKLIFIGQKGEKLKDAVTKHPGIDATYAVRAGKLRRYHGEGLKQLIDVKAMLRNIRDVFYVTVGIWQSYKLLKIIKPDIIFIKGGYVGVPVGLAAAARHIPYITHDSDALPGLANRIISRWASVHAVALPKNVYNYPLQKTVSVGVPISSKFQAVDDDKQITFKKQLKLMPSNKIVFATGGGMGAQRLNAAVVQAARALLPANPNLVFIHATGPDKLEEVNNQYSELLKKNELDRVRTTGFFVNDLYVNSGAADVVITRAGATNIAEFAAQRKACIIVPNPMLTGGHQLKNAEYMAKQKAAIVVSDSQLSVDSSLLVTAINELLGSKSKRLQLGSRLGRYAKPRASKDLAELLIDKIT